MTPTPEALAAIHAACFATSHPRPWSAEEITALLQSSGSFLLTRPHAFLIGRIILDEAELLTLATAHHARRQGLARSLLDEFSRHAARLGARSAFLEVAEANSPARALYHSAGWTQAGQRRDYYARGHHAIILTRDLSAFGPGQGQPGQGQALPRSPAQ